MVRVPRAPGTPPESLARLNAELVKALKHPALVTKLAEGGAEVITSTPEQFATVIKDTVRWGKVIRDASVRIESPSMRFAGTAITVEVRPGDNLMIHAALPIARPGDLIPVDGKGDLSSALMGETLSQPCVALGVVAVVIDGAVRDSEAIRALGFPMFAAGLNALLLACAMSVVTLDRRMRDGHRDKATHKSVELEGRTLGLVGLGAIDHRVARIAGAMGLRVIGVDPFEKNLPAFVEPVDLATLWRTSDAVSLHCPLTAENTRLANAETLATCSPGVIVVNTARSWLIDEPALLDAVQRGHVHSAGLDSFAVEPMSPAHPFVTEPRILLGPLIGAVTADAYVKMGIGSVKNFLAALRR